MKQLINVGAVVDDSTGDYLRQGGLKINNNFNDAYSELGDGSEFHPAGAWKTWTAGDGEVLNPKLGSQYDINTLGGPVTVVLPKGTAADYGRVIRLRDSFASWETRPVTVRPTTGDAVGGSTNPVIFNADFANLEFVYSSPANWRYIPGMTLVSLPRAEGAGVMVKVFKVTSSGPDMGFFTNISDSGYNVNALQVYRNGALLTYDTNPAESDYGSRSGTSISALNGMDIFIPQVEVGDVVTIISYSKDVSAVPVSYVRYDVQLIDPGDPTPAVPGQSLKIPGDGVYTIQDFGRPSVEEFNPSAFQLLLNGTLLVQSGTAGLPPTGNEDYSLGVDSTNRWNTIRVSPEFKGGDILTVIYFNNELGSILEWNGVDGILSRASKVFLNSEYRFSRFNKIRYTNPSTPNANTAVPVPGTEANVRFENVVSLLESIYPVGSIYMNANNPANPATYMGFGTWQQFGKGRAIFGFDDTLDSQGNPDPLFGINPEVIVDPGEPPAKVAGHLFGARQIELKAENIPELTSNREYMREAESGAGPINLSGCVPPPGSNTGPLATFELAPVSTNVPEVPGQKPSDITIIPPGITVYMWVRTT